MAGDLPRGTVTFLFSDIEGSTELSRVHGAAWGDVRADHRRILRDVFATHGGRELETEGDAFFIVFERALDAVAAAVVAQRSLTDAGVVRVRIGVHTTEPFLHPDGYVGVGVSRAARICAAASGGQIVASQATAGIVEDHQPAEFSLRDLGEHYLKDIPQPQRLYQIDAPDLDSQFPPLGVRTATGVVGTLLFIDLDGWSRVLRDLGDDEASSATASYHRIVRGVATANNGAELEMGGDHSMCVFFGAKDAVVAAAAIRSELHEQEWIYGTDKPRITAAIHTGRLARVVGGQLGVAAFHVTQLCATAEPGQVLVSHSTHALLEGELLDGLELIDLGERELQRRPPARVFELRPTERD